MKNILFLSFVLLTLSSCVSKKSADQILSQKDSLAIIVAQKDSVINDVFGAMNVISENLNAIKVRENIINNSISNGEIPKQSTTQISEDIEAINQLLIDNTATIAKLRNSAALLSKANVKIKGFESLIKQLNTQVENKNQEIEELRGTLKKMHLQVADLSDKVSGLNKEVSGLSEAKASLEGEVKQKTDVINTGYYIIGSEKELLGKEVVYKSGFIGRTIKINENRSLDTFMQVDIRNFDKVIIGQKKATLVSSHPAGSYEFKANSTGVFEALIITDKAKFWEYSKVLVVSYK